MIVKIIKEIAKLSYRFAKDRIISLVESPVMAAFSVMLTGIVKSIVKHITKEISQWHYLQALISF